MPYDAIVIGGGLAGSSAALQLARREYRVLLAEKDTFPRHKLCGEFLSPETQSSFHRLGVLEAIREAGAHPIERAHLTASNGATTDHRLPGMALGLSRYRLDELLFHHACLAGAEGWTGARGKKVKGSLDDGFIVQIGDETVEARLVIGAYGRRGRLDRTLDRPFLNEQTPYVAFKAHYAGPSPPSSPGTIELHSAPGGYCGLAPVEDGRINVCWMGTTDALQEAGGSPEEMLEQTLRQNPVLDRRLQPLTRVNDHFEAVSQVPLMAKTCFAGDVCLIGDSAGMIAPLCGDGMAMALESAERAVPLASDLLEGRRSPSSFRSAYRERWTRAFGRRMQLGRWIHAAAFRPIFSRLLVSTLRLFPPLARWLIRSTRSPVASNRGDAFTEPPPAAGDR